MSIRIDYAPMNNALTTAETCTMNKIEPFKEYVGYVSEWDGSEHVTDEQIVRCRDCKHKYGCLHLLDDGDGDMRRCDSSPDCFCAWGERRDA